MIGKTHSCHPQNYYILWAMLFTVVFGISVIATRADTPVEFSRPIPENETKTWTSFTGVGVKVKYPPGWQGRAYHAQGGVRDSATYEFVRNDEFGLVTRIEMLEITNRDTGHSTQTTELAYWQQYGAQRSYVIKEVTVQGCTAWWIHLEKNVPGAGLVGTLWFDNGERVYRFRLHSREGVAVEGEQRLRQMLSTLAVVAVDWRRAPTPSAIALDNAAYNTPTMIAGTPYQRGAALTYAQTYYSVQNNADGCYLWDAGSAVTCTYQTDATAVDGAHFVNQAVAAGGSGIPGLWDGAALRVTDLRDWLQNAGWTAVTATQAALGDVAVMGPLVNPCWAGLVVATGDNPTLATHSGEYWLSADQLYCFTAGQPTYEKTYLHVAVEYETHLPLVLRNEPLPTLTPTATPPPTAIPQPRKNYAGVHLGNHLSGDWPAAMLQPIDGSAGGVWPRAVVVQSAQLYNIWRVQEPPCNQLAGTDFWLSADSNIRQYLKKATNNGVTVIIRIAPSPGNFEEAKFGENGWWPPENRTVNARTLHAEPGVMPTGIDYCAGRHHWFRAVDDLAKEMQVIYERNLAEGWPESNFYFEPANEPNLEWYTGNTAPRNSQGESWEAMDAYFGSLMHYIQTYYPHLRVLTPSMSQGQYAEGIDWGGKYKEPDWDFCPKQIIEMAGTEKTGYQIMESTYAWQANWYAGYSWHNYYIQGRETYQSCENGGFHVSYHFPGLMLSPLAMGLAPGFVTETDLCSWNDSEAWEGQCYNLNPIHHKGDEAQATADSLQYYVGAEKNTATATVLWLTHNQLDEKPEYDWHEMYDEERDQPYSWFTLLWDMQD